MISALLAYLGDPLVDRLEARRLNRTAAVAVVFSVLLLLLLALLLVPRVEAQISALLQKLPGYISWLKEVALPRLQGLLPAEVDGLDPAVLQQTLVKHWREAGGVAAQVWQSVSGSGMALLGWSAWSSHC